MIPGNLFGIFKPNNLLRQYFRTIYNQETMSKQSIKIVSLFIVFAMMLVPFQSLTAAAAMSTMDHVGQVKSNAMHHSDVMMADDNLRSCEQCDHKQCCQEGDCVTGHCITCLAIVLPAYSSTVLAQSQDDYSIYLYSTKSFFTSPLLHPPKI